MNFGWIFFNRSKLSAEQQHIINASLVVENQKRLKLLTVVCLCALVLVGFGTDLYFHLYHHQPEDVRSRSLILHIIILAFFLFGLLIINAFERKAARQPKFNTSLYHIFTITYCIVFSLLTSLLTFWYEYNTSAVLLYTLSTLTITAFLLLKTSWAAIVFTGSFASIVSILVFDNPDRGNVASSVGLCTVISISSFIINTFLYKNYVEWFLHKELIQMQQLSIEQGKSAKDAILGVVAHDLRTPVANIDQLASLMQQGKAPASEEFRFLGLIKESCQQSYTIIDDLLYQNRETNGKDDRQILDLQVVLQSVLATNFKRLIEKNIHVEVKDVKEPLLVNINGPKFKRVFDNLLTNAVKFTPRDGNICIEFIKDRNHAIVKFEDSGIGIPTPLITDLFKPFSQARRKGTEGEKSTGLGLSIVKQIIEKYDGAISVKSQEGKGTMFTIQLPLVQ